MAAVGVDGCTMAAAGVDGCAVGVNRCTLAAGVDRRSKFPGLMSLRYRRHQFVCRQVNPAPIPSECLENPHIQYCPIEGRTLGNKNCYSSRCCHLHIHVHQTLVSQSASQSGPPQAVRGICAPVSQSVSQSISQSVSQSASKYQQAHSRFQRHTAR